MKITKLELKNFKRFDDLTIDLTSLAEPAKLVLLIGTNGSGKSSVFDAFEDLNKVTKNNVHIETGYIKKKPTEDFSIKVTTNLKIGDQENFPIAHSSIGTAYMATSFVEGKVRELMQTPFYGRSSVRQVPRLTRTSLGGTSVSFKDDSDRPQKFIDRDNRFENDIEKVASLILTDVFKENTSTEKIKENYINPINQSFENIFGIEENIKIKLISFKPPLEGKTAEILFEKGTSKLPYDLLSSGEKEIFNILFDLLARREYFQDTVFFFDEIDLHLNTFLQKKLLKEITENWIPDNCQLWTASHSLGFIEYANETEIAAIIDFDNLNFDVPQVITPSPKNNFDVFEIAVSKEFLAKLFEGKQIVFSENSDTSLYNNLSIENTIFFNARDKSDVFYKAKNNPSYHGLVDRDYLTDEERTDVLEQYKNLFVLNYYSIENYLYHPDNLEEYYGIHKKEFEKDGYLNSIKNEWLIIRDRILLGVQGARSGYPFYKENESGAKLKLFKSNSLEILQMFNNPDFETFYKIFPAKDYGSKIKERQNLSRIDLAKTNWFKNKITDVLIK